MITIHDTSLPAGGRLTVTPSRVRRAARPGAVATARRLSGSAGRVAASARRISHHAPCRAATVAACSTSAAWSSRRLCAGSRRAGSMPSASRMRTRSRSTAAALWSPACSAAWASSSGVVRIAPPTRTPAGVVAASICSEGAPTAASIMPVHASSASFTTSCTTGSLTTVTSTAFPTWKAYARPRQVVAE